MTTFNEGNVDTDLPAITIPTVATAAQEATTTDTVQPADQAAAQQTVSIPEIDLSKVNDPDMVQFYRDSAEIGEIKLIGDDQSVPSPAPTVAAPPVTDKTAAPKDTAAPVMIPKARFDEVNANAQRARDEAMYWRGVAEAHASKPGPQADATQQQHQTVAQPETIESKLAALAAEEDAIAERYDNGEINAKEMAQLSRDVRAREAMVREEGLRQQIAQTQPRSASVDEVKQQLAAEQQEQALYKANPHAGLVFPPTGSEQDRAEAADPGFAKIMESRRAMIKTEAQQQLLRDHPGITGPQADALYRETLARLANAYAPTWFNVTVTPPAGGTPALSPTAQARLAKIEVAAAQPPNPGTIGTSSGVADQWTSERYAALSDDQLAVLPSHIHDRFS